MNPENREKETGVFSESVDSREVGEKFFEEHRGYLEHYAGDASLKVVTDSSFPTMAVNLEKGVIHVNPYFFGSKTEKGLSAPEQMFGFLHEIEHVRKLLEILGTQEGSKIWKKHSDKVQKSRRFNILDNMFEDIQMNRSVVSRAPVMEEAREDVYLNHLFPEDDFTSLPNHLQFANMLARDWNTREKSKVSSEVRRAIERLEKIRNSMGQSVIDYATDPRTPMAKRIELQERFIEPVYERFFQEDAKEEEEKRAGESGEESDKGSGADDGKEEGGQEESGEDEAGQGEISEEDKEGGEGEGDGGEEEGGNRDEKDSAEGSQSPQDPEDPEDYFTEYYDEILDKSPSVISEEDMQKAVEEYLEHRKDEKTPEEKAEEAYAKAEGISIEDMHEYRRFWGEVENTVNPETDEQVIEELREVFKQIISERMKEKISPKYPTREGEILVKPAEAVAQIKAGIAEPEVWETVEPKKKPEDLYGNFDVTVVADRSGTMTGSRAREQRKAIALVLEALTEFSEDLEEVRYDLDYDLNVRTEVSAFKEDSQLLKPLSSELTEKQRIHVYKTLGSTPGLHTYDALPLAEIKDGLSDEELVEIESGKRKKLVIVMSDGESHSADQTKELLSDLRAKGLIVVGLGISDDGAPIESLYAPDGMLCEDVGRLAVVLSDLLKDHLEDLKIKK